LDDFTYPVWVEIDLGRFRKNLKVIRSHLPKSTHLIIVLKSDAYGHGLLELAYAAREEGLLGRIGVATNEEARWLREAGFDNPIIKLVPSLPHEFEETLKLGIEEIVSDVKTAETFAEKARQLNVPARVHIGLDTGMGRKGFLDTDSIDEIKQISEIQGIELIGMMTHFPVADYEDKAFSRRQIASYERVKKQLRENGVSIKLCHVANSAALLDMPDARMDAVRAGLIIYGLYPSRHVRKLSGIQPVMAFKTRVALVRKLPPGRSVGYTRSYITPSERTIATLPMGYNDGYFRHLSNKAQVLIRAQRAPVVGVVSMNLVTVDVTEIPGVRAGDEVVLFGEQESAQITAEEFGHWAGTINYEVTTRVGNRNHRLYLN
jgi:alanine racemase